MRRKSISYHLFFTALFIAFISPVLYGLPSMLQQSDEKLILMAQRTEDPFEFANQLRVKGVPIVMGQKFRARTIAESGGGQVEDWLEGLEFTLTNKSDKQMTYIHFEFQFPDTMRDGPLMVYRELAMGIPPKAFQHKNRDYEPLALDPGDALTIRLPEKDVRRIKEFLALRNYQLTDINKVVVQMLDLFFEDGVRWTIGGSYYRPNANAPGGYERINK